MILFISDPMDYFLLDPKTGELRTAKPLDKEALPDATGLINLTIRARELIDGALGSDPLTVATTQISVTIRDVNDSPPTFNQKEYFISLVENTAVGTPLPLDISVRDPDVGQNSIFSLHLEDVSGVFEIEPKLVTGSTQVSIRVAKGTLDYENPNQRKFIVLIVAEETQTLPKLSSTATLTVSITDANDNRPIFEQESYSTTISETANAGQLITTITAKDMDSGLYGDQGIRYSLSGTGSELFNVDSITGAITVAKCPVDVRIKRFIPNDDYNIESDVNDGNYGEFSSLLSIDSSTESGNFGSTEEYIGMENGAKYLTYQVNQHHLIDEINHASEQNILMNITSAEYDSTNIFSPQGFQKIDHGKSSPGKAPCLDYESQSVYFLSYKVCKNLI